MMQGSGYKYINNNNVFIELIMILNDLNEEESSTNKCFGGTSEAIKQGPSYAGRTMLLNERNEQPFHRNARRYLMLLVLLRPFNIFPRCIVRRSYEPHEHAHDDADQSIVHARLYVEEYLPSSISSLSDKSMAVDSEGSSAGSTICWSSDMVSLLPRAGGISGVFEGLMVIFNS